MALRPDQVDDLVRTTLSLFHRHKWTDVSMMFQDYVASELIQEKRVIVDEGVRIEWPVKVKSTGLARNTGLYGQDVTAVEDLLVTARVEWSFQTTNWSYDVNEEALQGPRTTLVQIVKVREHDALSSLAELNEENLWRSPSSPDDERPRGIPYWVVKSASSADGGFFGGNPPGHSSCAGIDATVHTRWRNWTFTYQVPSKDDLIRKIKAAIAFCRFRPPIKYPELGFGEWDYNIFTTYTVLEQLERLAEAQNDNLGPDLAKYMGVVTIGRIPIRWVPYLQATDTSNPVYGINWKVFRPFTRGNPQEGGVLNRYGPVPSATQHTVRTVFYDVQMNYICTDRRANFVGYQP